MVIRRASLRDVPIIVELSKELVEDFTYFDVEDSSELKVLIRKNRDLVWVYEYHKAVVGFLYGKLAGRGKSRRVYLEMVFVNRTYRGRGFGIKMVRNFEKIWIKKLGSVWLVAVNKGLSKFYSRLGYDVKSFVMKKD